MTTGNTKAHYVKCIRDGVSKLSVPLQYGLCGPFTRERCMVLRTELEGMYPKREFVIIPYSEAIRFMKKEHLNV